jgi:hypothetical protein
MDFDKLLKFAEAYLLGYFVSLGSLFLTPFGMTQADQNLGVENDDAKRTLIFAIISLILGTLALAFATGTVAKISDIPIVSIFFTLWLWLLFALFAHLVARGVGGTGSFFTSLRVCLFVVPSIYIVSSFIALTLAVFTNLTAELPVSIFFLTAQFLLLSFYLPPSLKRAHKLSSLKAAIAVAILPLVVSAVNVFFLMVFVVYFGLSILKNLQVSPGHHFT